ncbi:hypothetical protein ACWDWU_31120 [Streptomyces sp. NPDC003442]
MDEFLPARAMEHDSPTLPFRLGCEYLISARVIRPGPVTLVERVRRGVVLNGATQLQPLGCSYGLRCATVELQIDARETPEGGSHERHHLHRRRAQRA